jgi:hypothetical protein
VAGYIAVCAVITLIATAMMQNYTDKDVDAEHARAAAQRARPAAAITSNPRHALRECGMRGRCALIAGRSCPTTDGHAGAQ